MLRRIRERDPEALERVVREYLPQVFRAARGAGLRKEEAEDVAQATFTVFLEKAHQFEGRSHVRTWLFGILYRKIMELRRASSRLEDVDDIEAVMEQRFDSKGAWSQPPRGADAEMYGRQVVAHTGECLEQAPVRQRMAFLLREVEGMGTDEICKILEVTVTNLGVLLFRARNRLRECLEAKGVWS
ncbi:MAG: sigma-70 family RNA polymerase sigma factor [Acidobacteria bacterium]|nr:sigma-70 family RNA polymerase sigma factor [Acidobacteriota bacterium]